jgi:uncharacterized protein YegL
MDQAVAESFTELSIRRRPLHFFWVLDTSGSMAMDGKIGALNAAGRASVPAMRASARTIPDVEVLVRVITFAEEAVWQVGDPEPVERFTWRDVEAVPRGTTEVGRALEKVLAAIDAAADNDYGVPPAIVLVSDGRPTDYERPTFGAMLRTLEAHPWGRRASRVAIGIGRDADMGALQRFLGHDEIAPLRADNADQLMRYVRKASTVLIDRVSHLTAGRNEADALRSVVPEMSEPAGSGAPAKPAGAPVADLPPPTDAPVADLPPPPTDARITDLLSPPDHGADDVVW